MAVNATIVRRHSLPWAELAQQYEQNGRVDPGLFVPDPLPPAFPDDLPALIALWNDTFQVNFFRCREQLATLSEQNIRQVRRSTLCAVDDLDRVAATLQEYPETVCLFVDDDDWFAPGLVEQLPDAVLNTAAFRWSDFHFSGRLVKRVVPRHFPLLQTRLRRHRFHHPRFRRALRHIDRWTYGKQDVPLQVAGLVFQTNNYGFTGKALAQTGSLEKVIDHVWASELFNQQRLPFTSHPDIIGSATNKHPCSVSVLKHSAAAADPVAHVRQRVHRFVETAEHLPTIPSATWLAPLVSATAGVFRRALGDSNRPA